MHQCDQLTEEALNSVGVASDLLGVEPRGSPPGGEKLAERAGALQGLNHAPVAVDEAVSRRRDEALVARDEVDVVRKVHRVPSVQVGGGRFEQLERYVAMNHGPDDRLRPRNSR